MADFQVDASTPTDLSFITCGTDKLINIRTFVPTTNSWEVSPPWRSNDTSYSEPLGLLRLVDGRYLCLNHILFDHVNYNFAAIYDPKGKKWTNCPPAYWQAALFALPDGNALSVDGFPWIIPYISYSVMAPTYKWMSVSNRWVLPRVGMTA